MSTRGAPSTSRRTFVLLVPAASVASRCVSPVTWLRWHWLWGHTVLIDPWWLVDPFVHPGDALSHLRFMGMPMVVY